MYHVLQIETVSGATKGMRWVGSYPSYTAAEAAIRKDVLKGYCPDTMPANGKDTDYADPYIIAAEQSRVRAVPVVSLRCELQTLTTTEGR